MAKKITRVQVRAALKEKYGHDNGEAFVTFYRSPAGYYYFSGIRGQGVPSLYWHDLEGHTVEEIIAHVEESLNPLPTQSHRASLVERGTLN